MPPHEKGKAMKEEEVRPQKMFNRYLELARQDIEEFLWTKARSLKWNVPPAGTAAVTWLSVSMDSNTARVALVARFIHRRVPVRKC